MPNIKSAKKRVVVSNRKALQNQMFRSRMKTIVKKYETAVANNDVETIKAEYATAVKIIDHAAARGIIHKNAAARKKSQFTKAINAVR